MDAAASTAATRPGRDPGAAPRHRHQVALLCLMQMMLAVDISVVNVALPSIASDLGFSATGLSWVVTMYALVFGGLVLVSGKIGSTVGPRRALLVGAAIFVLASALGGLAQTPAMLVAARALQGLGAALAAPSTLVLLTSVTEPGPQRSRALSVFVIAIGGGAAAGLTLGGLLTQAFGWEAVMFVNVPIGLLVLVGVGLTVPEAPRSPTRLDVAGAVASTVTMAAAVHGLITAASAGWGDPGVAGSFVLAAAGLGALVVIGRRHPDPVVPLSFFSTMRSAAPVLAMMLVPAGQFGFIFFATLFTQNVLGFDPLQAGLAIVPFSAALILINVMTPRLVTAFGERTTGAGGMALLVLGLLWMAQLDETSTYLGGLLGPVVVLGLGVGLTIAPLTAVTLHQAPEGQLGAASSLNQAMQQLGGALGLAILTTIFGTVSAAAGEANGITTALLSAVAFPALALVLFATWARRIDTTPSALTRT